MKHTYIRVLLVDGPPEDHDKIKLFLQQSVSPRFLIHDCGSASEAMDFIFENKADVDIILLGLGPIEHKNAEKAFQHMHGIAPGIPIIIFSGATDHALAMLVMKEGAADNVTREMFTASPERLKDAIECSLSRNEILKKLIEREPAALKALQEAGATDLKESEMIAAAELVESEKTAAAGLKESEKKSATELKDLHVQHSVDLEAHEQILFWMSGGYSVDSSKEDSRNSAKDNHEKCAVELKESQRKGAAELKEIHKRKALELNNSQKTVAVELLESQQKTASELRK